MLTRLLRIKDALITYSTNDNEATVLKSHILAILQVLIDEEEEKLAVEGVRKSWD